MRPSSSRSPSGRGSRFPPRSSGSRPYRIPTSGRSSCGRSRKSAPARRGRERLLSLTALSDLAARNDSAPLDRLCQTLITAIERGSPLARVLHDQARDIREASRQRLMEEGGKREIAMLMPVVFLILPVTVLFALYPGLLALELTP